MQANISGALNLPGRRPKNSSRQRRAKSSTAPYVVGEIFAGICGLSSAFMCREYALGYAIEIETDLQNLIRRRHPVARLYGDVKLVKELPLTHLLCVSPPCQDVSVAGVGQGMQGQRTSAWAAVPPLIEGHLRKHRFRPTVIVENVLGALVSREGRCAAAAHFAADLAGLGYASVAWRVLDTEELGVPQSRQRIIIVASDEVCAATMLLGGEGSCGRGDVGAEAAGFDEADDRPLRLGGASGGPSVQVINMGNAARSLPGADVAPTITCTNSQHLLVVGPDAICGVISPAAAEILQGFPSGYTDGAGLSDARRLYALGNCVPRVFSAFLADRYFACLSRRPCSFRLLPEDVQLAAYMVKTGTGLAGDAAEAGAVPLDDVHEARTGGEVAAAAAKARKGMGPAARFAPTWNKPGFPRAGYYTGRTSWRAMCRAHAHLPCTHGLQLADLRASLRPLSAADRQRCAAWWEGMRRRGWIPSAELVALLRRYALVPEEAFTCTYITGDAHWTADTFLAPHPAHGGALLLAEVLSSGALPPGRTLPAAQQEALETAGAGEAIANFLPLGSSWAIVERGAVREVAAGLVGALDHARAQGGTLLHAFGASVKAAAMVTQLLAGADTPEVARLRTTRAAAYAADATDSRDCGACRTCTERRESAPSGASARGQPCLTKRMRSAAASGQVSGQVAALGAAAEGATFRLHVAGMQPGQFEEVEVTSFSAYDCRHHVKSTISSGGGFDGDVTLWAPSTVVLGLSSPECWPAAAARSRLLCSEAQRGRRAAPSKRKREREAPGGTELRARTERLVATAAALEGLPEGSYSAEEAEAEEEGEAGAETAPPAPPAAPPAAPTPPPAAPVAPAALSTPPPRAARALRPTSEHKAAILRRALAAQQLQAALGAAGCEALRRMQQAQQALQARGRMATVPRGAATSLAEEAARAAAAGRTAAAAVAAAAAVVAARRAVTSDQTQ